MLKNNMPKFLTFNELLEKANFSIVSKYDEKKAQTAYNVYCLAYENNNSGAFGLAKEILTRREKSHKVNIARQGKTDATAKIDGRLVGVEVKTNGGRIDNIKEKYVVYSININNSTGKCDISHRIIKTDTFLTMLELLGATKTIRHNGIIDGIGIQVSKRALWAWLETMTEYDRTREYSSDEIL